MPDEGNPSYARWSAAIRREMADLDDGAILAGRSVGATILINALAEQPPERRPGAIVLIAVPFVGKGGWPSDEFEPASDLGVRLPQGVRVLVFHGLQDETAPPSHADLYAQAMPQAQVHLLPGRDHQLNNDLSEVAEAISTDKPRHVIRTSRGQEATVVRIQLRDIASEDDRIAVMGLRRGPGQERYLDSMADIFAEADVEQRAMPHPWAVHDTETGALVGFVMLSDNIPEPMDGHLVGPYFLWKLLIDERFQGQRYGAATLDAVVDYLGTRPDADVLYTSCADGPGSPRGFYLRYGFIDSGRIMWGENVLSLDLR